MSRQAGIKILFTLFLIIAASYGIKTVSFTPGAIVETFKNESFFYPFEKAPHTELKGKHSHLITTGHTSIQKNGVPFYPLPVYGVYSYAISLENLQIKKSSLLIKEYLFHIYPSHNFW